MKKAKCKICGGRNCWPSYCKNRPDVEIENECDHDYEEDPRFASGMISIVAGGPKDMGEETLVVCRKCGDHQYIRVKELGSLVDMLD